MLVTHCLDYSHFTDFETGKSETSKFVLFQDCLGNSLAIQWLGLHTFTAEGPGSIPGGGPKIPKALEVWQWVCWPTSDEYGALTLLSSHSPQEDRSCRPMSMQSSHPSST